MDTPNFTTNEAARKSGKHLTLDERGMIQALQREGKLYFVKQNSVKLASEIPNVGMGISAVFAGRCNGVLLNERLAA